MREKETTIHQQMKINQSFMEGYFRWCTGLGQAGALHLPNLPVTPMQNRQALCCCTFQSYLRLVFGKIQILQTSRTYCGSSQEHLEDKTHQQEW